MANPKLHVEGVRHAFREGRTLRPVLDGVSLQAKEGEFVTLLGPSGCGKSTLFHLIGGLYRPDEGSIRLDGRDIAGVRGQISYMPQQSALLPWRTIGGNVTMALEIAGVPAREAKPAARRGLARVGLEDYEDAYPHMLSGGMQQRASFLRALLSPRELMCLDEPFGALDALTRLDMQRWLLQMWEAERRTVLFITHSIEEALFLSDRVYLLSARPARVLEEIAVPFPRPRDEEALRDPAFARLQADIYRRMRDEQERAAGATGNEQTMNKEGVR